MTAPEDARSWPSRPPAGDPVVGREKVPVFDPAAAPLEADAESAGFATPPAELEKMAAERESPPPPRADLHEGGAGYPQHQTSGRSSAWLLGAAMAVLAALGLAAAVLF
jgi:hypothetical protein